MINIRKKGFDAERAIADDLNLIVNTCLIVQKLPLPSKPVVQRNQNQSAVGGKDLIGTYGLAIEVKRQETLNVNTWWNQCVASARELNEIPVLLFRQSRAPWRCITYASLSLPQSSTVQVRAEIGYEDFREWFRNLVLQHVTKYGTKPTESLWE